MLITIMLDILSGKKIEATKIVITTSSESLFKSDLSLYDWIGFFFVSIGAYSAIIINVIVNRIIL